MGDPPHTPHILLRDDLRPLPHGLPPALHDGGRATTGYARRGRRRGWQRHLTGPRAQPRRLPVQPRESPSALDAGSTQRHAPRGGLRHLPHPARAAGSRGLGTPAQDPLLHQWELPDGRQLHLPRHEDAQRAGLGQGRSADGAGTRPYRGADHERHTADTRTAGGDEQSLAQLLGLPDDDHPTWGTAADDLPHYLLQHRRRDQAPHRP